MKKGVNPARTTDADKLRESLVKKLEEFVHTSPNPKRPMFLSASHSAQRKPMRSAADLLRHVRKRTPEGEEFVKNYIDLFVDFVTNSKLRL